MILGAVQSLKLDFYNTSINVLISPQTPELMGYQISDYKKKTKINHSPF